MSRRFTHTTLKVVPVRIVEIRNVIVDLDEQIEEELKMKLLTLEDYQKAGESFWPKYWYVAKELGEDAKAEDILKVMETLGGVALKLALEEKLTDLLGSIKRKKKKRND